MTFIIKILKWILRPEYRKVFRVEQDLEDIKRKNIEFKIEKVMVVDDSFYIVNSASFFFMYKEIFINEIYTFPKLSNSGIIIDAGANIGLSVIYFKMKYPNHHVIAFEPDKEIFKVLALNVQNKGLLDIELINKALWNEKTILSFASDLSDGGRINDSGTTQVETVLLSDYLKNPVEMLKMDIEGAETKVIEECLPYLSNVRFIFVEYHSFVNENQSLSYLLNLLKESGFRVHVTNPAFASEQAFSKRREEFGMDMQLNIYCFRN